MRRLFVKNLATDARIIYKKIIVTADVQIICKKVSH